MLVRKSAELELRTEEDLVKGRQTVRTWSIELGFRVLDQTKLVTAASELGRNTLRYGGGGTMKMDALEDGLRRGLKLRFEDHGPGIENLDQALKDGFTTGGGMGLGLGGSKRLVDEFEIDTRVGEGTRVTITKWK